MSEPSARTRESYELERDYAARILAAPARSVERRTLLEEAYGRFGAEPHHDQSGMIVAVTRRLVPVGSRVLEIGCGYGSLMAGLLAAGFDARATDVAAGCVARTRERIASLAPSGDGERVARAEIDATPFSPPFDLIVLDNVIEHIAPDTVDDAMTHCLGLLVPGGRVLVVTPHRFSGPHDVSKHFLPLGSRAEGLHLKEYGFTELDALFRRSGFARVEGFAVHPRLTARFGWVPTATEWAAAKARLVERIVPDGLLRVHRGLTRAVVATGCPAVCVGVKA